MGNIYENGKIIFGYMAMMLEDRDPWDPQTVYHHNRCKMDEHGNWWVSKKSTQEAPNINHPFPGFDANNQDCLDSAKVLNELNQLFVDTVRASGGSNATRYLMVPGYDASPTCVLNDYFTLPKDTADNRLIVSVHAYTPYSFALEMPGVSTFGTQTQKQEIVSFMNELYDRYITNGIPVIIGEFGASARW